MSFLCETYLLTNFLLETHCYNKSTKFQSNTDIFDGDITSSNFDVMSNYSRRHNSINKGDVILKLCQFISPHRAYLLVQFHDDRSGRTH